MKTIKILYLSCSFFILSSCALSNSIEKINYQPAYTVTSLTSSTANKSVSVEKMRDERGYNDEKVIFYKKNMYNQTMSGAYVEEKPVVEILTNAIQTGLQKKGVIYNAQNFDFVLKSSLQKLDYDAISGFSTVQLIPQITVKFQLIDSTNNKTVWTDIVTGKANTKGVNFSKFMTPAIDDFVLKLIDNTEFLNAIQSNQ